VSSEVDVAAPGIGLPEEQEVEAPEALWRRAFDNLRTGNLGVLPIVLGLALIVVFFSFKTPVFFSANNFNNIIIQMAGTCMLAYGVVFVLLLGEIDLSIGYLSGLAAVAVAELQLPGLSRSSPRSPVGWRFSSPLPSWARSAPAREPSWPRSACRRSWSRWRAF
jgi:hypothetical protein